MVRTSRYQLIEQQVLTNQGVGQRLYFNDQPQLRTQADQLVIVKGIETFINTAISNAPTGRAVATFLDLQSTFLVLNIAGTETMQYIPLAALNRVNNAANSFVYELFELKDQAQIDWTKSYLQFGAAVAAGRSFLLGVYYEYVPQ